MIKRKRELDQRSSLCDFRNLQVDSNATLTIQPGAHIYIHADAAIMVDGTLSVLGELRIPSRVYFTGDRLDEPYASYPGHWPGIYFSESSMDNILNYAVLQNGLSVVGR